VSPSRPTILIAGGGVAGLEALLALGDLLGPRARAVVLAPERDFSYRQFAVTEPFSRGEVATFALGELVRRGGGRLRQDALASLEADRRIAYTRAGAEIHYDSVILAVGARPVPRIPGAITYRGPASNPDVRNAMIAIDRGDIERVAFAVPAGVEWSLPVYELALLAAAHLREIGDATDAIEVVTHEHEPLSILGTEASARVRDELAAAGVALRAGVAPARMTADGLVRMDGSVVPCQRTLALPGHEVEGIPGVPQGPHGFVDTDAFMRVDGCDRVYAAGDATWFPLKQGGLATQQADAAASAIAAGIDPSLTAEPFRPRLRVALLTGHGPVYFRGEETDGESALSDTPLWWPPSKVAGRYLGPFIADQASLTNQPAPVLVDLEPGSPADADDHDAAVLTALAAADSAARFGEYENALRWLDAAERLDLTLPADYLLRRADWARALKDAPRA
jgi:sulfide:quinone oxidoreductase